MGCCCCCCLGSVLSEDQITDIAVKVAHELQSSEDLFKSYGAHELPDITIESVRSTQEEFEYMNTQDMNTQDMNLEEYCREEEEEQSVDPSTDKYRSTM